MTARTGDNELDDNIRQWLKWDKNEITKREIEGLVKAKDVNKLRVLLTSRMKFGTAGIRGNMGAGFAQMNDLTIIQTGQQEYQRERVGEALGPRNVLHHGHRRRQRDADEQSEQARPHQGQAAYMLRSCPNLKERGIVIGHDARHNSERWANLVAAIFINLGVKVYLFSRIVPTPFVPYSVLNLGCDAGIMVTASHNPKNDNGYKVYWDNGAQIISPHDKGIQACILENLTPLASSWDATLPKTSPLRVDPLQQIMESYYRDILSLALHKSTNVNSPLKFTYTAMHGVGYNYVVEAYKAFGFNPPIPVKEQVEPDPEFPTVKFPNPEEGKSALDLAMATADAHGSTVIIANDPDADRLAIAEKQSCGTWKVFSGNEMGALFGWWLWTCYKEKYPDSPASDVWMISSTVSTMVLRSIAKKEGFHHADTLTGFKWMANETVKLQKQGKVVLLAFEESIGFMCGCRVLDKDGISAAVVMSEMATQLAYKGISITQQLDNIYKIYGYHITNNSYYICHDQTVIDAMFQRIRDYEGTGSHPKACGKYEIKNIRDLTTGYDNNQPDNKPILPVDPKSHMITFTFTNGCVATIRTSGTEPKIKYYAEICADPSNGQDRSAVEAELNDLVTSMVTRFFQPERNNLIARSN
ncbi:PREDICTED: phosphoglucomutase-2-like isoform X1 [Priapulus caudatus]|uniref:Phosphoglucomutase-2-like isoform X1 n=2 Tax=Priapulus caudatus TaxID=37621 RepID=A0ABM1ETP4_PRICU|nr:PREDICTED: phosphoglucomutase-2-like isoform X1 [Priapulus caudatus]